MKNLFLTVALLGVSQASRAQTVLTEGHLDLGIAYEDNQWEPHIHLHDDSREFAPDEALLYYGRAAKTTRNADSAYDFIGVPSGAPIWRSYSSNVTGIPWLGFGFEEIAPGTFGSFVQTDPRRDSISAEWITLDLLSFSGPGHVSFFQGGGTSPTVWFATADGIDATDRFISTAGGHEHGSFVFTQPGMYTLTFRASALNIGSGNLKFSEPYTYRFGVETVPEPASLAVLSLVVLGFRKRRRLKAGS